MTLIAPDLLSDMLDLPFLALALVGGVGLGLWITGWWLHRFWITVLTSLTTGLYGLRAAPQLGLEQPVVAGILLALAGGCLALSLARLALFLIYGLAAWYLVQQIVPAYAYPLICITAGGLFSVFFFRFCMITLTSALGTLLMAYSGLVIIQLMGEVKVVPLVTEQPLLVHIAMGIVCLFGVVVQQQIAKALRRREIRRREAERYRQKLDELQQRDPTLASQVSLYRKAG